MQVEATELQRIECIECGEIFLPSHGNTRMCSTACRKSRNSKWDRKRRGRQAKYRSENPEKYRTAHYMTRYGITYEDAKAMHEDQDGACAICSKRVDFFHDDTNRKVHIDHCHTTGRVRGILCNACNKMLGLCRDSIEVLKSSIGYLSK